MPNRYPAETVLIEGADASAFAQSQFSSNLAALDAGRWQFGAWLDAQGRVRALFHLARLADDRLLLLLRGGRAETIAGALQRFVLRLKVRITAAGNRPLGTGPSMPTHETEARGDTFSFGCGSHALVVGEHADDAWRLEHIRRGWPWLPTDALLDALLPPAISLDKLQATAFDKGCYPGQEIVARLHYRGGLKRHMHRIALSRTHEPGSVLRDGERDVVQLLDAYPDGDGCEALAVMHDNDAQRLADAAMPLDDTTIVMLSDARADARA